MDTFPVVGSAAGDRTGITHRRDPVNALMPVPFDGRDPLIWSFSASYAGVVAFIAVATEGSFARAGDRLGVGRSAVSRSVRKLEGQLGTRLFLRSTRATSLTREGERFFAHCRPGVERILQALEEMRDLREGPPRGLLRIGATPGFGRQVVAPLLRGFRARFPEVALELLLDEREADLVTDGVDVTFREGVLDDSQVVARQLIPMRRLVCASPAYARHRGLPQSIEDLAQHACINRRLPNGRLCSWAFRRDGRAVETTPSADLVFNDPGLVLQAVLDGDGLAQLPAYQASAALRAGTLVPCLEAFSPDDGGHYLCYLSRQQLPKRIRAFVDFMTAQVRALDLDCTADGPRAVQPLAGAA